MDVDENDKSTTEVDSQSGDTQVINDETSSTTQKTTTSNADQSSKKSASNDANERDIKTAAASALAAAAVKAKVNSIRKIKSNKNSNLFCLVFGFN